MEILRPGSEVVLAKNVVSVGFGEMKSGVPVHFVIYAGMAVPTKYAPVKEYLAVSFATVEAPVLVPKIQNSTPKRLGKIS